MKPAAVVRCEVGAGDLVNRVANHSGQLGTNGWAILPGGGRLGSVAVAGDWGRGFDGYAIGWSLDPGAHLAGPAVVATNTTIAWQATVRDIRGGGRKGQPLKVQAWVELYDEVGNVITGSPRPEPVTISGDAPHVITAASTTDAVSIQYAGDAATARPCMIITNPDGSDPWPGDTYYSFFIGRLMLVQEVGQAGILSPIANVPFSNETLVWQDILGSAVEVNIDRGLTQDGIADRLEVGRATVTIRDASLDPDRSDRLRKGRPFRVTAKRGDDWEPLFTGEITGVTATYPQRKGRGGLRPVVTVTADDPVAAIGRIRQPLNYGGALGPKIRALISPYTGQFSAPAGSPSTSIVHADENAMLHDQLQRAVNTFPTAKMWMGADGVLNVADFANPTPAVMLTDNPDTIRLRNVVTNPSFETGVGGTVAGCTMTRSTLWAAEGSASLLLTSTGGSSIRSYKPATETGAGFIPGPPGILGWNLAGIRVTVKAAQACKVWLLTKFPDGWVGKSSVQLAAGTVREFHSPTETLRSEGLEVELRIGTFTGADPDAPNTLTGDLAWIDAWCMYDSGPDPTGPEPVWMPTSSYTDPDTGLEVVTPGRWEHFKAWYFDGSAGGTWAGTAHASASLFAPVASYTDIEPVFGLEGVTNRLTIARNNAAEPDGRKEYGPFNATDSVAEWGAEADTLDTVDPADPYALATNLLRRNALPSVFPRTLTVNAAKLGDTGLAWAEPYTSAIVVLTDSSISRPVYLLGITHRITPDRWMITYRCRTVDSIADDVLNIDPPTAGAATGPTELIPVANRYDTGWVVCPLRSGITGNPTGKGPQVRKIGNLVRMELGVTTTGMSPDTAYIVADVPEGFRPTGDWIYGLGIPSNITSGPCRVIVKPDGTITINIPHLMSTWYQFQLISWIL